MIGCMFTVILTDISRIERISCHARLLYVVTREMYIIAHSSVRITGTIVIFVLS